MTLIEKAGELAGKVWNALHDNGAMTLKELKKATKTRSEKDLYLALGWLLREDKITTTEESDDITIALK